MTQFGARNVFRLVRRSYATEAKFPTQPAQLHLLSKGPAAESTLTKEQALALYERMKVVRIMETACDSLYKARLIRGFLHLYSGQEAIAVGLHSCLRKEDTVTTSYRNHAWSYLFDNYSVERIFGELLGVRSGYQKGKGGSMHMYEVNYNGGNGIVGAHVSLATGTALAYQYTNTKAVSVVPYGDGAANQGQVAEAFNMAKLMNLPVLYLCENNQYAMGTEVARHTANPDFYKRGDVIPGLRIDGMDVISVIEATRFCMDHILSNKGPIIMEATTYRYSGHSVSDSGKSYRTQDEVKLMRKTHDPIDKLKKKIVGADLVKEGELKEIDKKAKKIVDTAVAKVRKDKPVDLKEIAFDVYANEVVKEVRGVSPFDIWVHKTSGFAYNLK